LLEDVPPIIPPTIPPIKAPKNGIGINAYPIIAPPIPDPIFAVVLIINLFI